MAVALMYNEGSFALQHRDFHWDDGTVEIIPVLSSYVPTLNDHHGVIAAAELAGVSGYTGGYAGSGRHVMSGKGFVNDTANNRMSYTASDPAPWLALGAGATIGGYVVAARGASDDSTMILLFYLGITPTATNGSDIVLTFPGGVVGGTQQVIATI